MKIIFGSTPEESTLYLSKIAGEFTTNGTCGTIHYDFDKGDNTVELSIEHQWFDREGLDGLIEFLKAVKEAL